MTKDEIYPQCCKKDTAPNLVQPEHEKRNKIMRIQ